MFRHINKKEKRCILKTYGIVKDVVKHKSYNSDSVKGSGYYDKIMADPELAKKMGQAGYERARDHFSWESIADKTVAVYQSVLDEQNK